MAILLAPRNAVLLRCARLLTLLLAVGTAAHALGQDKLLHKCVDATGKVSIQSDPCPSGSTLAWRRVAPTEPAPTASQQAQAEARILRDQQTVRELSEAVDKKLREASAPANAAAAAAPAVAAPIASDPCQEAQAFAISVREKSWLGLTDDQTRRLYTWVAEQCKVSAASDG